MPPALFNSRNGLLNTSNAARSKKFDHDANITEFAVTSRRPVGIISCQGAGRVDDHVGREAFPLDFCWAINRACRAANRLYERTCPDVVFWMQERVTRLDSNVTMTHLAGKHVRTSWAPVAWWNAARYDITAAEAMDNGRITHGRLSNNILCNSQDCITVAGVAGFSQARLRFCEQFQRCYQMACGHVLCPRRGSRTGHHSSPHLSISIQSECFQYSER